MSAADDLRAALLAHAPLVSRIGQRVRQDMGKEKDPFPYVIFRQVADKPERGIDGSLHARREVFQVESWGKTREESAEIHRLVEAALDVVELWPEEADPEALDPDVGARACVWTVDIWS